MKNLFLFSILSLVVFFTACSRTNDDVNLENLKNESIPYPDFFEKVANAKFDISDGKVVLISYEFNSENQTIKLISTKVVEPSWGLALDIVDKRKLTQKGGYEALKSAYKVTCDKGGKDGKGWTKDCDGKISCGSLIADCLDAGGCATICNANMVYVIETSTFYISQNLEDLIEIQEI